MLEIKDLNVHFGVIHALKGISLTVNDGEIVTLIGANGAGKTTTLRTISGLKKPTSGSILLDGKDITHTSPRDRVKMGMSQVPEGRRVFPKTSKWSMSVFPVWRTGSGRRLALCPAASSRCLPWAGR